MFSSRQVKAMDSFLNGYNCAQAVALAFAKDMRMSEEDVIKTTSAFGGGFARSRGLCGAVASMGFVAGGLTYNLDNEKAKQDIYTLVAKYLKEFTDEFGTANCAELLANTKIQNEGTVPDERNSSYYKERPCLRFVAKAVEVLENDLFKDEK